MNLIEKFGGYEAAKSKFRDNGSFHAERIKAALLEYRREQGIFEVGDKVVRTHGRSKPKIWVIEGLSSVFLKDYVCDADGELLNNFSDYEIRHATDEEIAAGHRL